MQLAAEKAGGSRQHRKLLRKNVDRGDLHRAISWQSQVCRTLLVFGHRDLPTLRRPSRARILSVLIPNKSPELDSAPRYSHWNPNWAQNKDQATLVKLWRVGARHGSERREAHSQGQKAPQTEDHFVAIAHMKQGHPWLLGRRSPARVWSCEGSWHSQSGALSFRQFFACCEFSSCKPCFLALWIPLGGGLPPFFDLQFADDILLFGSSSRNLLYTLGELIDCLANVGLPLNA